MKRIGLIGENSVEYLLKLLEIWNSGCSAVLIDWRIPPKKAIELLRESQADTCFVQEKIVSGFMSFQDNIKILSFKSEPYLSKWLPSYIYEQCPLMYTEQEALVLYSSGTTGKAKGIRLSHRAIQLNADKSCAVQSLDNDSLYLLKPLTHSSSIVSCFLVGVKTKSKMLISPSTLLPNFYLDKIRKEKITTLSISPVLLKLFTETQKNFNYHFCDLKNIRVSGGKVRDGLIRDASCAFGEIPIYNGYGLTETGPAVAAQGPRDKCYKIGAVGSSLDGVKVKIIKENSTEANAYESGIIHIKTDSLYSGYIIGNERQSLYKDWFNSGDIGYIDRWGNIFVTGRSDNMISVSGHNVYPEKIEEIIMNFGKSIDDCVVKSQEHPILGEQIICYYSSKKNDISSRELTIYCNDKLANYEIPQKFIRIEKVEYSINGKKIRNTLKQNV